MITTATAKRPHICQLAPRRVLMARSSKSETDTTLIVVKACSIGILKNPV